MNFLDDRIHQRFWDKCIPEPMSGCWLFMTSDNGRGYSRLMVDSVFWYAHRFAYTRLVGPIPEGLQLDHKCRVRCCVNPAHLEPVTNRENTLRGNGPAATAIANRLRGESITHCKRGHEFNEENTYLVFSGNGRRQCRTCSALRARERREARA